MINAPARVQEEGKRGRIRGFTLSKRRLPSLHKREKETEREEGEKEAERERDVGIICVIIYDDLALKAWTQRERERESERVERTEN